MFEKIAERLRRKFSLRKLRLSTFFVTYSIVNANVVVCKDRRYLVEEFTFRRILVKVVTDTRSAQNTLLQTHAVVSDGCKRIAWGVLRTDPPLVIRVRHVEVRFDVLESANLRWSWIETFQVLHLGRDEYHGNGVKKAVSKKHILLLRSVIFKLNYKA